MMDYKIGRAETRTLELTMLLYPRPACYEESIIIVVIIIGYLKPDI